MTSNTAEFRKIHGMAGNLFPVATSRQEAAQYALSDAQITEFRQRGFIKGPRILEAAQIDVLREGLERIRKGENPRLAELYEIDEAWKNAPEQNVFHFLGAWRIDEAFHDILFHPAVSVPVSQLLNAPRVRFWHDQVFYKPPRHPGVVAWHQDYSYWTRSIPSRHLTVWIGLDDTTVDNGCIYYVPESHKWPLLPKLQLLENMDGIKSVLSAEQLAQFKPEPMLLKAGECSIHDSMTLHGSYGNTSDGPRRGVVLNYMHPETRSADAKRPLLLHTPIIPEGEIIEGDDFPIVYDETTLA